LGRLRFDKPTKAGLVRVAFVARRGTGIKPRSDVGHLLWWVFLKSIEVHLRSQVRSFSWLKPEEPITAGGVSGLGRKSSDLSACKGSLRLKTVEVV